MPYDLTSIIPRLIFKHYALTFTALCIILTSCDPNSGGPPYLTNVKAISAGNDYTIAIKDDGTLWAWGSNFNGKLGNGTTTDSLIAIQIGTANNWKAVSAGFEHTVALKEDDTVWAWGYNYYGQLGDGNSGTFIPAPVQVKGKDGVGNLEGIIAVSAGNAHTVALKNDGTIWAWGYNYYGQLGDGLTTNKSFPVQVMSTDDDGITFTEFTEAIEVSAGDDYTVAIKEGGTIWAWGRNDNGQLGNGLTTNKSFPVQVMSDVIAISAGRLHTVAIDNGNNLWSWGSNDSGQLGNDSTTDSNTPIWITSMSDVKAVSAGAYHTVAIKEDGAVWAWGGNYYGVLGDGTYKNRSFPVQVKSGASTFFTNVKAISAGSAHTVAIKEDGSVWAWGNNYCGILGDATLEDRLIPRQVLQKE